MALHPDARYRAISPILVSKSVPTVMTYRLPVTHAYLPVV